MNGGDQPPSAAALHRQRPLARRDAGGRRDGKQSEETAAGANGAEPPVEANARPSLARQGERQERQRVSQKTPHPKERSGKECVLKKSRALSGALRGTPAEGVAGDSAAAPAQGKTFPLILMNLQNA